MTCTKVHDPILSILEPLIGGLCFNLLGAYALAILLGVSCWIGIILSMVVWYGAEAILHLVCGWRMTFMTPLAWVARDLLHPLFMIGARIGHRVEWRGEAIDMRR